jgi:chromosome segregation ATPase
MPRKNINISDVLREEVKKDNSLTPIPAETSVSESTPTTEPAKTSTTTQKTPSQSSEVNPSELETKITQLTTALATVTKRADGLQTQVGSLETELQKQKKLVRTLQEQLKQAQAIQAALEEQKKLVAKLTTELTQTQAIQSELNAQKELVNKLYAELQSVQTEKTQLEGIILTSDRLHDLQPRPYSRYVAPTATPTVLSNEVIGWFD